MSLLPDWLTGYDAANAEAAAAADAKLRALGLSNYDKPADYGVENQRAQIDKTFTDEVKARADSIIGTPLRILGEALKATLFSLPLWVWLIAAGGLFFWLGGPAIVRRLVQNKFK